ncbi:hypothetical protein HGB07_00510 [Candidatus Roizmanbacteria bacterium]|nr:hypothetical protein [Candidatus Roizmanbacteria bacterium]
MITNRLRKHIVFIVIGVFVVMSLGIAIGVGSYYFLSQKNKLANRIYPHVYIDHIDVGYKTKEEVNALFKNKYKELSHFNLTILHENAPIATFSAAQLNLKINIDEITERAYLIARSPNNISRFHQQLASIFNYGHYVFTTKIDYDKTVVRDFIASIEDQYNKPAKNALFTFENGKVSTFRTDEKGTKILSDKLLADVDTNIENLHKKVESKTQILQHQIIEPEISLSKANNFGIEELIGEGKSNYTHSIPGRVHNVILAASKFHGVMIPQGKTFSFDEVIGDISALTGYQPAYVIKNGKTVLGDGGGVCQVSTTMFRAALNAGLPIVERHAHAYRVGYYENDSGPGFDATIFAPSVDLKVKNDTPGAILIQTEVDQDHNILTFKLYGKKDSRKVEISPASVYNYQPAPPAVYQDDPTLKRGETKQVDYSASGASASFNYKVTKNDSILVDTKFVSDYKPWAAVYLVGTAD